MENITFENFLLSENNKEYKKALDKHINDQISIGINVIPKKELWYRAFLLTPFSETKVIILGQDPYPNEENAVGLAFSSNNIPKSLHNIYLEYSKDLGFPYPKSGNLTSWAKEGVLLLNTILTVVCGFSLSHQGIGWETFSENYIKLLNDNKEHLVFILWGSNAIKYEKLIDSNKHLIIKSSHPSPLSAYVSFFGSKPFSKTNEYLVSNGIKPINWKLDE